MKSHILAALLLLCVMESYSLQTMLGRHGGMGYGGNDETQPGYGGSPGGFHLSGSGSSSPNGPDGPGYGQGGPGFGPGGPGFGQGGTGYGQGGPRFGQGGRGYGQGGQTGPAPGFNGIDGQMDIAGYGAEAGAMPGYGGTGHSTGRHREFPAFGGSPEGVYDLNRAYNHGTSLGQRAPPSPQGGAEINSRYSAMQPRK